MEPTWNKEITKEEDVLPPGNYVGMPAGIHLDLFAKIVNDFFGGIHVYLVGSAVVSKKWRDVDVAVIISREKWDRLRLGDTGDPNRRWNSLTMAFAALGRQMTGLPIDFKIQEQNHANELYPAKERHYRMALGIPYARTWDDPNNSLEHEED